MAPRQIDINNIGALGLQQLQHTQGWSQVGMGDWPVVVPALLIHIKQCEPAMASDTQAEVWKLHNSK